MQQPVRDPGHADDTLGFRERARQARNQRRQQWQEAQIDLRQRVDDVAALLPSLLTTPIPDFMKDWAGTLCRGLMVGAMDGRHHRIIEVEHPRLATEVELLLPRIEVGEAGGDDLRRLVSEARGRINAANDADQAALPGEAASLSEYVRNHMRMTFRPHARVKLDQAMLTHLQALAANPLQATLDAETELGRLELAYAAELDRAATPAPSWFR